MQKTKTGLSKKTAARRAGKLSKIIDDYFLVVRSLQNYVVLNANEFLGEPDDERVELVYLGGELILCTP